MSKKKEYRVRNWRQYNKALMNRGSLTIWFEQDSIASWYNADASGERGHPVVYSDVAIRCALTLRAIYRLPLRATKGFLNSLIQ